MKVSQKLFYKSGTLKPTAWIGKGGITVAVLDQIKMQLKTKELVKVKIQRTRLSSESAREIAESVAKQTSASLIDIRGRTFTLYRKASKTRSVKTYMSPSKL
jgi:putative YhbY family RNA-binding protein